MDSKIVILCASALFVQLTAACPTTRIAAPNGLSQGSCGCGYSTGYDIARAGPINYGVARAAPISYGGAFPIGTLSSSAPLGLSVRSENSYQGNVNVCGRLPFVGTVGLKGVLPTAGSGAVSYGCGTGAVGVVEEGVATGIANAGYGGIVPGYNAGVNGYNAGFAGYNAGATGCGCNRY